MQPTYLPWVGYFDLIDQVDVFVFLDDVQFEKQSWQQRNRIRSSTGLEWITVPVLIKGRFGQVIRDVETNGQDYVSKHVRKLAFAYGKAAFFDEYGERLSGVLAQSSESQKLCDVCLEMIQWLCSQFGIQKRFVCSSDLAVPGKRSERLVNLLREVGAKRYLSPLGSKDYLWDDRDIFANAGIDIEFQAYDHPTYRQVYQPFEAHASAVDLLYNEGPQSLEIIRSGRRPSLAFEEVMA